MKAILILLIVLTTFGCHSSVQSPDQRLTEANGDYELNVGQSLFIGGLSLTFDSVPSDSRCPGTVDCVWAGDGAVILSFSDGPDTLHTTLEPRQIVRAGYTLKLITLSPYPEYPQSIPLDAYVIKLRITKNNQ